MNMNLWVVIKPMSLATLVRRHGFVSSQVAETVLLPLAILCDTEPFNGFTLVLSYCCFFSLEFGQW